MNLVKKENTIGIAYVLATLAAVVFTWLLHEFSHWATGGLLGDPMVMTLNACYPKSGGYTGSWHEAAISMAGPVVTLTEAVIFYWLLKRSPHKLLFPFLLTCFYMRLLAGVMNFINLNDEGRVSRWLGMGTFALPVVISGILFYLVYDIVKTRKFSAKLIVLTLLLIMLFSSIIILADQAFKVRIL